jgi:hypothetical protein
MLEMVQYCTHPGICHYFLAEVWDAESVDLVEEEEKDTTWVLATTGDTRIEAVDKHLQISIMASLLAIR